MVCTGTPHAKDGVLGLATGAGIDLLTKRKYSDADMVAAGFTPMQISKFKANTIDNGHLADAFLMTEIAYLESGLIDNCHGVGPVDDSYGLWQINTLGGNWNTIKRDYGLTNKEQLFDPATNARVAAGFLKPNVGKPPIIAFHPWIGTYQKALQAFANGTAIYTGKEEPNASPAGPQIPGVVPTLPQITNPLDTIGSALDGLKKFFEIITSASFWKRLGIGLLGALVIIGALVMYNKDAIVEQAKKGAEVAAVAA